MNTRRIRSLACAGVLALGTAGALRAEEVGAFQPKTYGVTAVSYLRVPAAAFLPFDSDLAYTGAAGTRWGT